MWAELRLPAPPADAPRRCARASDSGARAAGALPSRRAGALAQLAPARPGGEGAAGAGAGPAQARRQAGPQAGPSAPGRSPRAETRARPGA